MHPRHTNQVGGSTPSTQAPAAAAGHPYHPCARALIHLHEHMHTRSVHAHTQGCTARTSRMSSSARYCLSKSREKTSTGKGQGLRMAKRASLGACTRTCTHTQAPTQTGGGMRSKETHREWPTQRERRLHGHAIGCTDVVCSLHRRSTRSAWHMCCCAWHMCCCAGHMCCCAWHMCCCAWHMCCCAGHYVLLCVACVGAAHGTSMCRCISLVHSMT